MSFENIKTFFSSTDFLPHIHCYLARPSIVWTMFTTDTLIGLAYVSIAFSLYALVRKIRLPFSLMFLAFGLFIFACGMTHFMEVYTLWPPAYWTAAFVKIVTASTSVITAIYLIKMAPNILLFAEAAKESQEKGINLAQQTAKLIKSNEELRNVQDRYRLLIESVKDYAVFMLDSEGRIETWNEGARHIKQYNADEIIGKHFSVFYTTEDIKKNKPAQELIDTQAYGRFEDEGWRLRKDGRRFWANVVITPIYDKHGALIGYSKIVRDLTERKKAEEALKSANDLLEKRVEERTEELRESEALFRTFADSMPQLAWIAKADGHIFWFNKGWYNYTGGTPDKMEGWGWQSVHDPKALPKVMAEWKRCIDTKQPLEMTFQLKGADDKYKWFITRVIPIFNSKGELIRWFGTHTNIDERNQALESANKELEAFSYSVSHDLRAPLRSIDGFSRILYTDYFGTLDEKGKDYLNRIRAAAQKMGQLIDALLSLSRVSRTKMKGENVDLSSEVKRQLEDLKQLEPSRQVNIVVADGLVAYADPELIRILFQNLLSNAWKFTSKKDNPTIEFGVNYNEGRPVYFVRDTGAGFDMAYIGKLFGAFQRLHSDSEFEGTGIGLATVQRIIHRHGGEVWAQAKPNEGATFFFTLKTEDEQ